MSAFQGILSSSDLLPIIDISEPVGERIKRLDFEDFEEELSVANMDSGTAADGTIPTADGIGGIAWETAPTSKPIRSFQ